MSGSEWSRFDLKGWQFRAYLPNSDNDPQEWHVTIIDPQKVIHTLTVPMDYAPVWGPDASDVFALNEAIEVFIAEHGIES